MDDSQQPLRPVSGGHSAGPSPTRIVTCGHNRGAWCLHFLNDGRDHAAGPAPPTSQAILDHLWRTGLALKDIRCHEADGQPCPHAPPIYKPKLRELWARGRMLHRFGRQARNLIAVVQAFQDAGWPDEIPDPLGNGPEIEFEKHLHDAATALNHVQERPQLIRFSSSGRTIRWDFLPD